MKHFLLTLSFFASAAVCSAQSIAFSEKFDDATYDKNFIKVYAGENKPVPSSSMKNLGFTQNSPWVVLKDEATSTDICFGTHSQFTMPGIKADYRLYSRAIEIPTQGYVLSLDAQSWSSGNDQSKLSDLEIYVSTRGIGDNVIDGKEPDFKLTQVPTGASEKLEGEFTNYTFSLDQWAGEKIYLIFVNRNTDKEVIAIDNVLVARDDLASIEMKNQRRYSTDVTFAPTVTVTGLKAETFDNFTLTLSCNGTNQVKTITNAGLTQGNSMDVQFDPIDIAMYQTLDYTVTLTADNVENPISYSNSVTRIAYYPERKVVVEEGTGTWCGNCPLGAYAMSHMSSDPEMSKYVVGIAVHNQDVMTLSEYDSALGVSAFPKMIINRTQSIAPMTSSSEGYGFGEGSGVYAAQLAHEEPTYVEVALTGGFNADSTQISCTAAVKNAYNINDAKYKLSFVIIENNVTGPASTYAQTNYFANSPFPLGGWEKLGSKAKGVYYHEVARAIDGFNGIEGSVPTVMEAGKAYTFERTLSVPNTVQNKKYLELVVMIIDSETGEIMNADKLPLTDVAEDKQPLPDGEEENPGGDPSISYNDDHTNCSAPHVHVFPASSGYANAISPSGRYIGLNLKANEGLATFYDLITHQYVSFGDGSTATSEIYAINDDGLVTGSFDSQPVVWNSATKEVWNLPSSNTFEWAGGKGISADGKTVIGSGYGSSGMGFSGAVMLWKWDEASNSYRSVEISSPKPADNKAFQYVMIDGMNPEGTLAYGHAATNQGFNVPLMWKADDLEGCTGEYVSPEIFVKTTQTGKTNFNEINSDMGFISCDGKKVSFVMYDDYNLSTPCVYDTESKKTIGYYNDDTPLSSYLNKDDAVKVDGVLGELLGHMLPDGSIISIAGGATLYRDSYVIGTDGKSVDLEDYLKDNYDGLSIKQTGVETSGTIMAVSADGKVFAGFAYNTLKNDITSFYVNTSRKDLGTDTTGIVEVETDDASGKTEYYDLQGRRVLTPGNGIYIVKTGNKTVKKLISNK